MATKPVTAGSARVALPAEVDAGAAAGTPAAGGAASAKAAQAAAKASKATKPQSASRPGSSASSRLGKSVDKALGKTSTPRSPGATTATQKSTAGYATSATTAAATGEWAFLSDKSISIEDKLFRFLMLAQKKNDAELVKKMEEYRARFTAEGKAATAGGSKGSSFFDVVKAFVPAVGVAAQLIGEAGIKKLVGQITGPALAAAATAAGMPALAPLALQLGGSLAAMAFQDVGAKAGTGTSKADANSPDERVAMFELQRLAEKQQAMFTAISNTLKCMHDTQMSAIHNIR